MWLLDKMLTRLIRKGRLNIIDHDGKAYTYGDPSADPLTIRFTDKGAAMHIARDPRVGAGEAYMDGRMVVEPPHDIRDFVLFVMGNASGAGGIDRKGRLRKLASKLLSRIDQINERARAAKNVVHHYDLTRQFYELFLDEDRQYTMAYFRDPSNSLERAQVDKKALIAAKLRLIPGQSAGMRVLDIGCGWGGLGLYLNRHYGCEVLGVSLAPDQVKFANERAEAAGVADKVKFQLIDYRDVTGQFDRITSVGMIEHVGAPNFGEYFAKTNDLLDPDGIMLTHTIGRKGAPGTTDKWTRKYIFPGGYIPAMSELVSALERNGWEVGDVEVLRYHYAYTLAEWYRRATMHRDEIVALYDERLFRMWQFYLAGAEQSFRHGSMVNFHIQSVKRRSSLPMTRDYMQQEWARLAALDEAPEWHLERKAAE
ncbi:MAG: SAM-dependent methyltransferase [Novosphingobium sp. 17-62-19]|uniref:SAM-dependent methyltransferase n=1 Tax=Novosphingobium sp. 17-62-19 TaxID=1970406 RepID=UPI000BD6FD7E|nr:cyclopropane-fatty-acyl-phospholipid synthase family protein [Novosphingobium sp. 17-62-19]OZA21316.1 MAG: SAM-dependent methyltransferase [Novosphingobium sp. 17-62-19]HQS95655.1 cyclopropane-fatty-acyl-phospholipid synthase family protein [Novosphingobium sp.]